MAEELRFDFEGDIGNLRKTIEQIPSILEAIAKQLNARAETIDVGSGARTSAAAVAKDLDAISGQLQEVARDASQMGRRLEDAGRTGSIATGEVATSLDRVARSARQIATDPGVDAIAPGARKSAAALGEVSKELRRAQEFEDGLSEATRRQAATGTEAARRIQEAFRLVSDQIRTLGDDADVSAAALEALGASPTEFLPEANNELEQTVILLARTRIATRQMAEEATEGLGGFADRATKARTAHAQLAEIMERSGDRIAPELRREFEKLGIEIEQTFQRGAKQVAEFERQMRDTERRVRSLDVGAGSFFNAREALNAYLERFPQLSKVLGGGAASVAVFASAYRATRDVLEGVNKELGINIDAWIADRLAQGQAFEAATKLLGIEEDVEEQERVLAQQRDILTKRGIEFIDTQDGIAEAWGRMERAARGVFVEGQKTLAFLEDLRGFSVKAAESSVAELAKRFGELNEEIARDPALVAEVDKRLAELEAQAKRAGDEISGSTVTALQDLRREVDFAKDGLRDLAAETKQTLVTDTSEAVGKSVEQIRRYVDQVSTAADGTQNLGQVTQEQAGLIVGEIDRILERIAKLPTDQREAAAAAKEELEGLKAAYAGLTEAASQQLETIKTKTVESFRGLAESLTALIKDVASSLPATEVPVSADPTELRQQLAGLQQELAGLGGGDGLFANDEAALRAAEIEGQIRGINQQLAILERQQVTALDPEPANQLKAALVELVANNDQFRAGYEALGPAGQSAIRTILEQHEALADQQGVTREGLAEMGAAIRTVFNEAGIPVKELGLVLDELAGKVPGVRDAFAVLEEQGPEESLARLNQRLETNIDLQKGIAEQAAKTGEAVERDLTRSLVDLGRSGGAATDEVERSMNRLAVRTSEVGRQMDGVVSVLGELSARATAVVGAVAETAEAANRIPPGEEELGRLRELVALLEPLALGIARLASPDVAAGLEGSQIEALTGRLETAIERAESLLDTLEGIRDVEVA